MTHEETLFDGNAAQRDLIEESIAKSMLYRIRERGVAVSNESPPMVKWLVGAIAGLGAASMIGMGFWLVSSVSNMRETLARMDERQSMSSAMLATRFQAIDDRLARLEGLNTQQSNALGGGR